LSKKTCPGTRHVCRVLVLLLVK